MRAQLFILHDKKPIMKIRTSKLKRRGIISSPAIEESEMLSIVGQPY